MLSELKLLLIGCGKMGSAMLDGWIHGGVEPKYVDIIDPNADKIELSNKCNNVFSSANQLKDDDYDICIIAVKPQILNEVLKPYAGKLSAKTIFVSVAAGITVAKIKSILGEDAKVLRAMPNLPATIGEGLTGLLKTSNVSYNNFNTVVKLLRCNGNVVEVNKESDIDKITALSGSAPAYVFHFIEALEESCIEYGFSKEDARIIACQTIYGSAKLAKNSMLSPTKLRENVTSPNGTTQAALNVLMDSETGLKKLLKNAIDAAKNRSEELSN